MTVRKYNNNKWYYDFGYEGKRYKKKGFLTKRDAQQAETIARNSLMQGILINNKSSFIEYYNQWIEVNKKDVITPRAYQTFVNAINQFKNFLENENINDVSMENFNTTLYRKFIKWYGQDHATESVRKVHNCIKASIEDAIQEGLMLKDPTYKAIVKGTKPTQREEDKFMSIKAFNGLKKYVKGTYKQSYLFIYLLIVTGGRFGEVQRLNKSDFNFLKNTIHLPGTKTETSDRIIDIPKTDMKYIQSALSEMPVNIRGELFNTGTSLITNNSVTKVLQKYCLENCLGKYTLHSIRHTHCSYLLHNGVSIYYISKRLGHKNIKTTMDVYSHLLDETAEIEKDKAMKAIESMAQ
ncbi:site-specific integrase [Staphylococcus gallinarum]|uniref:tyrosine-type recombinase/integrase n=1 Tax=Staphylococcus gallinarum TaxID=1293 RepID=UPI002DB94DEB|nr:tyrosine-type recombinase/integrase [Staphylococcus gallinarum]MEB6241496.1 site-specific integrase [Staphylococcus gallinarum]MEB6294672.1 site-specific integrase [Staphylococcus gallinarum]